MDKVIEALCSRHERLLEECKFGTAGTKEDEAEILKLARQIEKSTDEEYFKLIKSLTKL